jgi:hypothetical protein
MPDQTRSAAPAPVWQHAALLGVLAFSTLKAVKMPMPYAASHYLITYEDGFVRRGLAGEVLSTLGAAPGYGLISAVGSAAFAVCLGLIWVLSAGLIGSGSWLLFAAAMVYASSMAVVYLAGTIGYFDHLFVIFAVLVLLTPGAGARAALCLMLGAVGILVHEASLLMVLPTAWFAVFMAARGGGEGRALALAGAVAGAHVALTWATVHWGTLSADVAAAMLARADADFEVTPLLFEALSTPPGGTARETLRMVTAVAHADSILIVAPSLAALLFLALRMLRASGAGRPTMALACAAALAPIALHALARDIHRWDAMAVTAAFLVLMSAWRDTGRPMPRPAVEGRLLPVFMAVIAIGAGSTTWLVSHQELDFYPFFELRQEVVQYLSGTG